LPIAQYTLTTKVQMEGEGEVVTGRRVMCKTKYGNEKEKERGGREEGRRWR
jgi:hypothetical protein